MKLTELNARWKVDANNNRTLVFLCPCCRATTIRVPIGAGVWTANGENLETLTVSPSVDASNKGHWHGHITNGRIN